MSRQTHKNNQLFGFFSIFIEFFFLNLIIFMKRAVVAITCDNSTPPVTLSVKLITRFIYALTFLLLFYHLWICFVYDWKDIIVRFVSFNFNNISMTRISSHLLSSLLFSFRSLILITCDRGLSIIFPIIHFFCSFSSNLSLLQTSIKLSIKSLFTSFLIFKLK